MKYKKGDKVMLIHPKEKKAVITVESEGGGYYEGYRSFLGYEMLWYFTEEDCIPYNFKSYCDKL